MSMDTLHVDTIADSTHVQLAALQLSEVES